MQIPRIHGGGGWNYLFSKTVTVIFICLCKNTQVYCKGVGSSLFEHRSIQYSCLVRRYLCYTWYEFYLHCLKIVEFPSLVLGATKLVPKRNSSTHWTRHCAATHFTSHAPSQSSTACAFGHPEILDSVVDSVYMSLSWVLQHTKVWECILHVGFFCCIIRPYILVH